MTFITPFAFVLFALAVPITAFYFIRQFFRQKEVSYLRLWQLVFEKKKRFSLFEQLKNLLSLLFHLLLLTFLVLAIAGPEFNLSGQKGKAVVLVDNTASMNALDVRPSRLEWAKARAKTLCRSLRKEKTVMVAAFSDAVHMKSPYTSQKRLLISAVNRITPTYRTFSKDRFSDFIKSSNGKDTHFYMITDSPKALPSSVKADIITPPYQPVTNTAILNAGIRKSLLGLHLYELYVAFHNFSDKPIDTEFHIYKDDLLWQIRKLSLKKNSGARERLSFSADSGRVFRLEIAAKDDFPLDNRAYFVLPVTPPAPVNLSAGGGFFLQKALAAIGDVDYRPGDPAAIRVYNSRPLDNITEGRYIVFNPRGRAFARIDSRPLSGSFVIKDSRHPLAAYVEPEEFESAAIVRYALRDPSYRRSDILTMGGLPMLSVFEKPGTTLAVFAFSLGRSDFAMRAAFPILMANLLKYLTFQRDRSNIVRPGEMIRFDAQRQKVRSLRYPSGKTVKMDSGRTDEGFLFFSEPGVYTVSFADGAEERFACNLNAPLESDLRLPRQKEKTAAAGTWGLYSLLPSARVLLVFLALLMLLGEWYLYHQRLL